MFCLRQNNWIVFFSQQLLFLERNESAFLIHIIFYINSRANINPSSYRGVCLCTRPTVTGLNLVQSMSGTSDALGVRNITVILSWENEHAGNSIRALWQIWAALHTEKRKHGGTLSPSKLSNAALISLADRRILVHWHYTRAQKDNPACPHVRL